MHYTPFHYYFLSLANKETRSIIVLPNNHLGLPPDEYGLMELFCETPDYDCRRVMFMVVAKKTQDTVAVINFGWESRSFYEKWYHSKDKTEIDELKDPSLNRMSQQSQYVDKVLELVSLTALKEERLKRHYHLFKDKIKNKTK